MSSDFENQAYFTAAQVRERFGGVSHMWITRAIASRGFPRPITFGGRRRFWKISEVLDWEQRAA